MLDRRPPSKNETLLSAILFTVGTLVWVFMAFKANANAEAYSSLSLNSCAAIVVIGGIISAVFWHRFFTMDKKK